METIAGHILIANPADWSVRPRRERTWMNEETVSVTGGSSRRALRAVPLAKLTFTVCAATLAEQAELADAIRAAKKSGRGCAPYHGRGTTISDLDGEIVTLAQLNWDWQAGDYIFARQPGGAFKVFTVTVVNGAQLTLDGVLAEDYLGGEIYPLLFGKLTSDDYLGLTAHLARTKITITELVSARSTVLGGDEAEAVDPWIFN